MLKGGGIRRTSNWSNSTCFLQTRICPRFKSAPHHRSLPGVGSKKPVVHRNGRGRKEQAAPTGKTQISEDRGEMGVSGQRLDSCRVIPLLRRRSSDQKPVYYRLGNDRHYGGKNGCPETVQKRFDPDKQADSQKISLSKNFARRFTQNKYHRDFSKYHFRDITEQFLLDYTLWTQVYGGKQGNNGGIREKLQKLRAVCLYAKETGVTMSIRMRFVLCRQN